jgi:hypothetical protein
LSQSDNEAKSFIGFGCFWPRRLSAKSISINWSANHSETNIVFQKVRAAIVSPNFAAIHLSEWIPGIAKPLKTQRPKARGHRLLSWISSMYRFKMLFSWWIDLLSLEQISDCSMAVDQTAVGLLSSLKHEAEFFADFPPFFLFRDK